MAKRYYTTFIAQLYVGHVTIHKKAAALLTGSQLICLF